MVKVLPTAKGARNFSQCDSLLMGNECGAHTFPYIEIKDPSAQLEHEATTSKIGEDQIFYCNQRGIDTEKAIALIVNGFSKEVLNKLPMEFAIEAQKTIGNQPRRKRRINILLVIFHIVKQDFSFGS